MNMKKLFTLILVISFVTTISFFNVQRNEKIPTVAIANYGPHSSLDASIKGVKEELTRSGFIENKKIKYEIADVGFDSSLIPQMISKLKSSKPKVMVVMTTPVAQFAKGSVKKIPLVYSVITDSVEAGLINKSHRASSNMTGSSDKQDLRAVLKFARKIIPKAKTVGLLYATAESNDVALVRMMREAAKQMGFKVVAVPIDQARDIPIRMQSFKGKVDFIYVGTSGPIQPTLPVIAVESNKMGIPIINADDRAVKDGMVLASFGVDYIKVGNNTGKLVAKILNGADVSTLVPLYPKPKDHRGFINRKKAKEAGISIPKGLTNLFIVG
jgi:putative tryptophan/tyrosine transport system substrate-binding protein